MINLRLACSVAQSSTLLYRRVALCEACGHLNVFRISNAQPSATRRYSRVEVCATGGARRYSRAILQALHKDALSRDC